MLYALCFKLYALCFKLYALCFKLYALSFTLYTNIRFIILSQYSMTTKKQELQEAFKSIEKQFGKGAIMRMGDNANVGLVSTFHSGSYVLDLILG